MRALRSLLLCLPALLCLARPAAAQAEPPPVVEVQVDFLFGERITISGRLAEGVEVDALSLHMEFQGDPNTLTAALEPGPDGAFSYTHLVADRLAPAFTEVFFRFVLSRPGADLLTTERFSFFYDDNRFEWRTLESDPFTVHWIEGDAAFAQQILDAANGGLRRGQALLGEGTFPSVDLYIYATLADYQVVRGQFGQRWAGGHADPAAGLVIVSLAAGPEALIEIERKIPHEVGHLVLFQAAGSGYANLPAWLNEGIASLLETFPNPDYDFLAAAAVAEGRAIPLADLCAAFPGDAAAAQQAYAQSTSLVRMVEQRYGPAGLRALVAAYAGGASCALGPRVDPLGMTLAELEATWRSELAAPQAAAAGGPASGLHAALPWLLIAAVVLFGPVLVLVGGGLRKGGARG